MTYGTGDNVRILRAAMKLPIGLKGVDNYGEGSVAAPIDLDSGKVGRGAAKFVMEWVSSHPETGKRFEGMTVPCWNEVLALSRQVAKSMPDVRCVGWDVAVTTDGVRIIEGNCSWGTGLIQGDTAPASGKANSRTGAGKPSERMSCQKPCTDGLGCKPP